MSYDDAPSCGKLVLNYPYQEYMNVLIHMLQYIKGSQKKNSFMTINDILR